MKLLELDGFNCCGILKVRAHIADLSRLLHDLVPMRKKRNF